MRAIIYRESSEVDRDAVVSEGVRGSNVTFCIGALPVAGRSLILRQLQWLRSLGVEELAIELAIGHEYDRLAQVIARDSFGRDAHVVRSEQPIGPRALAEQVGYGAPVLALCEHTIGDGDLTRLLKGGDERGCVCALTPPPVLAEVLDGATVSVVASEEILQPPVHETIGWGAKIRTFEQARILGHAVLTPGSLPERGDQHAWPIIVHAHQERPGIWLARGARVHSSADLQAPVLLGKSAVVSKGAKIGPDVFLGERAVIAADACLRACFVEADTLVGEGVELAHVAVSPTVRRDLCDPSDVQVVDNRRVLSHRDVLLGPLAFTRIVTTLLLIALVALIALLLQC